ncbi:MAG: alkylation repair protein [Rhizobium sp.]|nr:alkylation repair protein [Rhizobium sp.]
MTLGPSSTSEDIVAHLKGMRDEANIEGMGRFGIETGTALGISNTVLRSIARQIKRDHGRALALWASGIREARLLAAFTGEPKKMTGDIARAWASEFNSWEIVDGVSDLFCDAGLQGELLAEFADDEREFVRRAAFAMMAWSAVHMKKEPDATLIAWLPLIETCATDPRNFVKKAVNWALRQIGKRDTICHAPALALAEKLAASSDKTARWIGRDAVKELSGEKVLVKIGR